MNVRPHAKVDTSSNSKPVYEGLGWMVFVIFFILKLTHNIDWSWWWVTAPLWIPLTLVVALRALIAVLS